MKKLKYLWAYSAGSEQVVEWHNRLIATRRNHGYHVDGFCLTPMYLNQMHWIPFPQLDHMWKVGYPPLMRMYQEFSDAVKDKDVLIHYNGANIHPEVIQNLNLYKVYTAGDDPESTEILTKPVAPYYDLHLVNNVACVDMYKAWGLKNVYFWPLGSLAFPEDVLLNKDDLKNIDKRHNKLVYIGERNQWKDEFLSALENRFSYGAFWGRGWKNGYISDEEKKELYLQSQIGVNVHNSSGPINFRTYELPAYGVMQICDNKEHLGKIFELNQEVAGFQSAQECMEKIEFYLSHPIAQREIALAGWERWMKDYTPEAVWEKLVKNVDDHFQISNAQKDSLKSILKQQEKKYNLVNRMAEKLKTICRK